MKFFFALLLIPFAPAFAISEQDVVNSVLQHFPLIDEAVLKARAAEGELTAAEGNFDHKLSFKGRNRVEDRYDNQYFEATIERQLPVAGLGLIAGHRQGAGFFPAYEGKMRTSSAGEIFAGISIPLLRNLTTDEFRTDVRLRQLEKAQADEEVRIKKMVYVHKALSLYYKWLLDTRRLKVRKAILKLAEDRDQMLRSRFRAGDIERLKLTDNQRSIDKRRDEALKAEIELNKTKASLSLYVRDPDGSLHSLENEVIQEESKLSFAPLDVRFDAMQVPQIKILDLEREKLQALEKLYRQQRLPGLNVEVLGARELSPLPGNYDQDRMVLGLKFDFPIENRKAEGKTVAAEYKTRAINRQYTYLQEQLLRYFEVSVGNMAESKKRWEVTSREYENTKVMADAEKRRWDQGQSDFFIVNLREEDVADVEIRRWTTLYEYQQFLLDARLYSGTFNIAL